MLNYKARYGFFMGSANIAHSPLRKFVVCVLRLRRNTHWHQNASFDSLFSRADLGPLGKGWIARDTTTRRLPYLLLFYSSWNSLYIAVWPTDKHSPDTVRWYKLQNDQRHQNGHGATIKLAPTLISACHVCSKHKKLVPQDFLRI